MTDSNDAEPLKAGDHFGDYVVERKLGSGAMGAVYLVRAPDDSLFAVKIMFPGKMTHDLRSRFAHEADFAMKIRHRNLISVYDVGEDPETGLCYIIMDYVPGGTLSDRIKAQGRIPVDEAVKITMQIAAGLDVAHKNGLVHRDVKPDNIMFDADGTPKLADLGVAKFDDDRKTMVTMTGMVIGTPAYMSPEQLMDSHRIDARADIYSLGVVLYEMLAGTRPNSNSTAVELLAKAIKGEKLPDIRKMCPEISAAVAHVLSLMCAPKPDERPATSIEAANLLHKAVTGKLVLPKKPPRAADARRAKLRPVVAALVATACAAVLGVCGILYFSGSGGTKPDEGNVGERAPRERPTTACYVQDGLIAMWDGIENAGRGRHDPLVKVWKNLTGGPDAVPVDGLAAWSENSALFGIGRYYRVDTLFDKPQAVTVEVCHHAVPLPMGSNFSALFSSCQGGGIGFQGSSGSHWLACVAKPTGGYYSEISLPVLRDQGETLAFTVDDVFTVYRNATVFSMVSGIKGIRYNENHVFQMGRDSGNTGDISGEIYSIRLYSRSLSADEIRRNHEVDRVRFGLDRVAPPASSPATGNERKITVLFPRLDRDPQAWAYSFEEEPGWHRPDYDDSKWKRAQGGFGERGKQTALRVGRLNTRWNTKRIFLRRHFNWAGGNVSRVVADIFHDDGVNLYLNGSPICAFTGPTVDWIPCEIPVANFVRALKEGDNVFCAEVANDRGPQYFDCGMIVECGGPREMPIDVPDGIRKVSTEAGTWIVKVENGVAQIGDGRNVALDPQPRGTLMIPAELDGLKITKLAKRCFKDCKDLIGVKIPEGIRFIESGAFSNCRNLREVAIPDSLERVGIEAFFAAALESVDLNNIRVIERSAFKLCGKLEHVSVNPVNPVYYVQDGVLYDKIAKAIVICPRSRTEFTIPIGTEMIADAAFQECKLRSIVIPDTIVYVGHSSFSRCPELEEVVFKGSDARIDGYAFSLTPKLAKVVLPHHLTQLDDWGIFEEAGRIESIDLPDSVEILGDAVFKSCPMLKNIRLGKSLRIVRHRAFSRCRSLEGISFPATVKEMGDGVLSFCPSLKTVRFEGERPSMGKDFFKGSNPASVTFAGKEAAMEDWRPGPSSRWFVEWDKALAEAKKTGKKIFALNTGSDWCHWCKKLKEDVLDKTEFEAFAERNLVLLYLDSPSRNPLGKAQKAHNKAVVKALGFGGGVPNAEIFSADGRMLGRISGGGQTIDAYIDRMKKILGEKGSPVRSEDGKMLFGEGYGKLAAKIAEERAKLPPVMKEDFKATLTGVAVCDRANRKFDNLEFMPSTTHLEVARGKIAVFRVEHDFPKGYAAAVWVTGKGRLFSNPSGRYPGKGVKYGFLGLHDAQQDVRLDSIAIRTNSEPELDDFPRGWMICSPKVDIVFLSSEGNPSTEKKAEEIQTAQANGYDWRYVLDANGKAILSGNGNDPCLSPRPKGKVVVPAELNGHKVVAIGHMAFHDCPEMTAIEFPEGIEEIRGWYIFARCYGLTEVTLPKSMRRIGTWVFESCENLRRVNLMNCERADNGFGCNFIGCYALEEILCAKNNKAITSVNGVLYSKDEKTLLAYPKARDKLKLVPGVENIANSALVSLPMNHVEIPEGIVFVNGCNFEHDRKGTIKEVVFPKSLRKIAGHMFKGTKSVNKVVFCGDAPEFPMGSPFMGTDADIIVEVAKGSTGWNGHGSTDLPERWPLGAGKDARRIRYIGETDKQVEARMAKASSNETAPSKKTKVENDSAAEGEISADKEKPIESYSSKGKLHALYRSKDRKHVFVEVCHQHVHDSFKTPPFTLDRVREAISDKADILFFTLVRSKDGVLFSAERENLERISNGMGSVGDHTAAQLRRMRVKHRDRLTTKSFATFEDMIRIGRGKILFKVAGFREYTKELEALLDRLDAWESVMVESWEVPADRRASPPGMWNNICLGKLQVTAIGNSFNDWKEVMAEPTASGAGEDLQERGMLNIPERVFEAFTYGSGKAERTDDEAGWEKALKEGVTVFRTNRPKELVKYLKKRKRRNW